MKSTYKYLTLFLLFSALVSCVDDSLMQETEDSSSKENFNIDSFSNGYSLAFDMNVDFFGDKFGTRSADDAEIEEWESYLDPEEFRVLFFDSKDRFLFESKSRWFTPIATQDGGRRWRVGVPVFQYLNDGFDKYVSDYDYSWVMEDSYNWERIAEIMRTEPFKIAVLANRPSDIGLHTLSDFTEEQMKVKTFGKNGPFWGPKNSVASYDLPDEEENKKLIKKVFDLHHCQYDPYYENKSTSEGEAYDFIMEYSDDDLKGGGVKYVPHMGAVSDWIHSNRKIEGLQRDKDGTIERNYYKLPKGQILEGDENGNIKESSIYAPDKNQYIPMYGIQLFEPLKDWKKGTTYYLSEQSGSQTGSYDYKTISLLRSVVKLELRIPKYDKEGNEIKINHKYIHICGNNILARNEPMDIWTSTQDIWKADHLKECEWLRIKEYGLYCDKDKAYNDYRSRLSWFYGNWESQGWILNDHTLSEVKLPESPEYPRIFNPMTQRLQRAMITDCYLPIDSDDKSQCYHRWIVYCGERNMNDPQNLDKLTENSYISTFRVEIIRTNGAGQETSRSIYNLAITDYSDPDNPIWDYYKELPTYNNYESINYLGSYPDFLENGTGKNNKYTGYYEAIRSCDKPEWYPYPLLRNHHYRLTLNFGNGDDIDLEIFNGEQRVVDDIFFN